MEKEGGREGEEEIWRRREDEEKRKSARSRWCAGSALSGGWSPSHPPLYSTAERPQRGQKSIVLSLPSGAPLAAPSSRCGLRWLAAVPPTHTRTQAHTHSHAVLNVMEHCSRAQVPRRTEKNRQCWKKKELKLRSAAGTCLVCRE